MQIYRVKLNEPENHSNAIQVVNGYLGKEKPFLYKREDALVEALCYNGKIEPVGKNYRTDVLKLIQIPRNQISTELLELLESEATFYDTDKDLSEKIYYGNVFNMMDDETKPFSNEILEELAVLDEISTDYQYVMLITH